MTQINLFGRRHRGMLENEKVEDYFTSNNTKMETEQDEEQSDSLASSIKFIVEFLFLDLPFLNCLLVNN